MPAPVYRQRDPQRTPYYQCIEDHFEMFEQVYEDRFEILTAKGKITQDMIKLLDKWRHTGFNVYCGPRILPWQCNSMASGS